MVARSHLVVREYVASISGDVFRPDLALNQDSSSYIYCKVILDSPEKSEVVESALWFRFAEPGAGFFTC
jgi:hypothetical protein